jgi:hypothetical protein
MLKHAMFSEIRRFSSVWYMEYKIEIKREHASTFDMKIKQTHSEINLLVIIG